MLARCMGARSFSTLKAISSYSERGEMPWRVLSRESTILETCILRGILLAKENRPTQVEQGIHRLFQ